MAGDFAAFVAMSCLKILLTVFNFLLWAAGILVLGAGVWSLLDLHKYVEVDSGSGGGLWSVPYLLTGAGCLVILLGSFACCCTVRPQAMLLYTYSFLLLLVFFVIVAAEMSVYAFRNQLMHGYHEALRGGLQHYGSDRDKTAAVDFIQEKLHCCGYNSTADWSGTPYSHAHNTAYPPTCCARSDQHKCIAVYNDGCYKIVSSFISSHQNLVLGLAAGLPLFQVFGIVLACALAKNSKQIRYIHI